jgi:general secretion pathway protein D
MKERTMNKYITRTSLLALGIALLTGCAGDRLHREGMSLLEDGRYEEGIGKLHAAVRADPGNAVFLSDERRNREQVVARLLVDANSARSSGQKEQERLLYERILRIEPGNSRAQQGLELLAMDKRHVQTLTDAKGQFRAGNLDVAAALVKTVLVEDAENADALQLERQIQEATPHEPVLESSLLAKFKKPVTLQFRDAGIKTVLESLSRISGINILLDKDVRQDLKITLFVKDVSVEDAIGMILMQSQLERKVMSDNMLFIYPNTQAKTKEYQDLVVRSFHLTNADPKAIQSMLKTLLKTNAIFVNEKTNSIIIRDSAEAVQLAEKLIADQDIAEPEVMMEVEVLEVSRTRLSDLGVLWPSRLTLTAVGTGVVPGAAAGAVGATAPTLNQLRAINGNNIVTAPNLSVALSAMLTDTDTNIIASPRIRARNREKAKIMIGERVPIITQAAMPVAGGAAPVVNANVRYLDVGLTLEVEPDIHLDNEVAIKINMEVSSITNTINDANSGTRAYQIGTRNASTLLQLKDGETQILGGLIDNQMRNTANKVPGLGQIPGIGRLFSAHQGNGAKTEIILSITPHIVGKPHHPEARDVEYWSGTEATLRTKAMQARSVTAPGGVTVPQAVKTSAVPLAAPAARPVPPPATAIQPAPAQAAVPMPPAPNAQPAVTTDSKGSAQVPDSSLSLSSTLGAGSSLNLADTQPPGTAGAAPTPAAEPTLILNWSAPATIKVGDKLVVPLDGKVSAALQDVGFRINYETSLLKLLSVTPGSLVKPEKFSQNSNESIGYVQIGLSDTGTAGNSGRIATLEFEVLGSAVETQLTLDTLQSSAGADRMAAPAPIVLAIPEGVATENAP